MYHTLLKKNEKKKKQFDSNSITNNRNLYNKFIKSFKNNRVSRVIEYLKDIQNLLIGNEFYLK